MKPGDRVLVEATVTMVGEDLVAVAIERAGVGSRVENMRVWSAQVRPMPVAVKKTAA